jgi:hypothetical protein
MWNTTAHHEHRCSRKLSSRPAGASRTTIPLAAPHYALYSPGMSRGRKLTKVEKRERRERRDRNQQEDQAFDDLVQDTVGRFTCSTEIAGDFAYRCHDRAADLDLDLTLTQLGQEIWQDTPQTILVAALAELAAEEQRHRDALADLGRRFDSLAEQQNHQHLDPPDAYRHLVRKRLLPDQPQPPT